MDTSNNLKNLIHKLSASNLAYWFSLFAGALGVIMSVFVFAAQNMQQTEILEQKNFAIEAIISSLEEKTSTSLQKIQKIENTIDSLQLTDDKTIQSIKFSNIGKEIDELKGKINLINSAIVENPEKAMSIPLLRKDLNKLSNDVESAKAYSQQQIDRLYDLFKWFIPAFAGLSFSLLMQTLKKRD